MLHDQFQQGVAAARTPAQLDQIVKLAWGAVAEGQLTDDAAQAVSEAVEARRVAFRSPPPPRPAVATPAPRQAPRSPDKQASLERRRRQAASGALPPALAAQFTQAEAAALAVIAREVQRQGKCCLMLDAIAAMAGCSRTSAQNALRQARRLGLLSVEERRRRGQKSDTNVICIVSPEWRAWLRLGGDRVQKGEHHGYSSIPKLRKAGITGGASCQIGAVRAMFQGTQRAGKP
jgi:hypothetical protein